MRNEQIALEAVATERILEETESSIAEIERILRKPLAPTELSKLLSLYNELTLTRDACLKYA